MVIIMARMIFLLVTVRLFVFTVVETIDGDDCGGRDAALSDGDGGAGDGCGGGSNGIVCKRWCSCLWSLRCFVVVVMAGIVMLSMMMYDR